MTSRSIDLARRLRELGDRTRAARDGAARAVLLAAWRLLVTVDRVRTTTSRVTTAPDPAAASYWSVRGETGQPRERYTRQY